MKKILIIALILLGAISAAAGERGDKAMGVRMGYNTRNESAVAGLMFQYTVNPLIRIAPNVDYVTRHYGADALAFNLNAHFTITSDANRRFMMYPLAGVSCSMWNYHNSFDDVDDVSTRKTRFGLNLGAGMEYRCTKRLKVLVEGKFNWVKAYSSGVFTAGIAYCF